MNLVKSKLIKGHPVSGVLSPSFDPVIVEMSGLVGLDYFMVEGEHGSPDPSSVENICRAAKVSDITPLARVRSNDPKLILQYLEAGIQGIMLPGVKEADEVKSFVESMKYPPDGRRGLGPSRANNYLISQETPESHITKSNDEIVSIVQIETREAYENLEQILSVPGIDLVVIGIADLSLAMGYKIDDRQMREVADAILEATAQHNIPVGMVALTAANYMQLKSKNVAFYIIPLAHLLKTGWDQFRV